MFVGNLTFSCLHKSLVPSLSACLAAGFVPSMHCLLVHYPRRTRWTVGDRAWGRAGGVAERCLWQPLLYRDWIHPTVWQYLGAHILHWEVREIEDWKKENKEKIKKKKKTRKIRKVYEKYRKRHFASCIV